MFDKIIAHLFILLLIQPSLFASPVPDSLHQSKKAISGEAKSNTKKTQAGARKDKTKESDTGSRAEAIQKKEAIIQRRALQLLPKLLEQAQLFVENQRTSPLKRLLIQSEIADLLWNYDQPRARQLFVETFNAAGTMTFDSLSRDTRGRLRNVIINYLLKRDKLLAEKLAASVATENATAGSVGADDQSLKEQATLYLDTALSYTNSDPERAARLIKDSLNGWLSPKHIEALHALRSRSSTLADKLFLHALSLVPNYPAHLTSKIGLLASYVFPGIEKGATTNLAAKQDAKSRTRNSHALIVPFLEFVSDTLWQQPLDALASESNDFGMEMYGYHILRALLPYFDQYHPEKSALIRDPESCPVQREAVSLIVKQYIQVFR